MISITNAFILARTKLKIRKIRTVITVIVASLMFGILIGIVFLFTGFQDTATKFSNEGLNNRLIIQASQFSTYQDSEYYGTAEAKTRAKKILAEQIDLRAKRAKELSLPFDKLTETANIDPFDPNTKELMVDFHNPVIKQLLAERNASSPLIAKDLIPSTENLKRISQNYHPIGFYTIQSVGANDGTVRIASSTGVYPKQDFETANPLNEKINININQDSIDPITQAQIVSSEIAKPFIFTNQTWKPESGHIPIILSTDQAQKYLGLTKLHEPSPADSLARIKEVQQKSVGFLIKECYSNNVATNQLQSAYDHEANKGKTDYSRPDIIYGIPVNNACQLPPVLSDRRSAEQKKYQTSLAQYHLEFNQQAKDPIVKEITFEVIGLSPAQYGTMDNGGLLSNILSLAIGTTNLPIAIPDTDLAKLADAEQFKAIFKNSESYYSEFDSSTSFLVELASVEDAKSFIEERDCYKWFNSNQPEDLFGGQIECPSQAPFMLFAFGNNRIEIESLKEHFVTFLKYGLLVVTTIAAIIMSFTVGRLISDSRRESAVFRAIGFKRSDINAVYGLYTLIVCIFIIIVALLIGFGGAIYINYLGADELTTYSLLTTNSNDMTIRASLLGFNIPQIAIITGAILLVGLLGIIIPLIRNNRRNPIKDMRDES